MVPRTIKILVVDDMHVVRNLVISILESMGFKTFLEAENGEEAMKVLKTHEANNNKVQLIISDWNMPIKTGLTFLEEIRADEKWKKLPFIMLTAEAERANITQAIMAGASGYIVKPFSIKDLESKLETAWNKHHNEFTKNSFDNV